LRKSLAFAFGLQRVILPKANAKDLRKLPDPVRNAMEFILVERFVEVIHNAIPGLDLVYTTTEVGV